MHGLFYPFSFLENIVGLHGASARSDRTVPPQRHTSSAKNEAGQEEPVSDSLTVFPSFFSRQRSDDARKRILTSVDSKDQYQIAPMLDKQKALKLLEQLQLALAALNDGTVAGELAQLIRLLSGSREQAISIKIWADMSIRLETLSGVLDRVPSENLASLTYLKLIVKKLEYVSRFNWMQQAHTQIVDKFTQAFVKLIRTNSAANTAKTVKGTVEVSSPLDIVSFGGSAGYQVSFGFDDEGYGKTYRNFVGDGGINIKLPFLKFRGAGSGVKGEYDYCRTARDHAICYFNELLANNRASPEISLWLSRKRTLGEQDKVNEVEDFYITQKDYVLTEKAIARNFSLFLSLDYARDLARDKARLQESQATQHQARITPGAKALEGNKKKAEVVHGKIRIMAGAGSFKAGVDTQFYEGSATLKGEVSNRKTTNTRYATLCDLLDNPYANFNARFKEKLKKDVREKGLAIREKVHANWYPGIDDATCALSASEYQKDPGGFAPDFVTRLFHQPAFVRHLTEKAPELYKPELYVSADIARLSKDLKFLGKLHAQRAMGNADIEPSIAALYKMYGAENVEECLKNMAVLAAYFYEQLGDKKSQLAAQVRNLETSIYATGIPHRPDVLRKLGCARQDYHSITSDTTVEFLLKNEFKFPFVHRVAGAGLGFKCNWKELMHYNPSRSGQSRNFELTLSGELGVDRKIIKALAAYLRYEGAFDMAELFESESFADLSLKGTFAIRYFLPKDPGQMSRVHLDSRLVAQLGLEIDASLPVGDPGYGQIALGVNMSSLSTQLLKDMPSSDTMYYFNIYYMHALFTRTITIDPITSNEVTVQHSYWHELVEKHQETLKQLFVNVADDKLSAEFDQLKNRYLSYDGVSEADRAKVDVAQLAFLASAADFRRTRSQENYQHALEGFKSFMRAMFEHWRWTRELSEAFDPYQYEFNTDAVS